ncbi:MAG: hypothetical protein SPD47_01730 [Oscillospiraceae bacterium]|nr:hypothetical protein [Oscillospiraceae bacterium]
MAIIPKEGGRFSYARSGEFRCRCKIETLLTIIFLALILVGDGLLLLLANRLGVDFEEYGELLFDACFIWAGICVFIIGAIHTGVTYKYFADDNEFKITDNHKHTEYLFYSDIVSVEYSPIKLFSRIPRGFHVTITTEYRTIEYDYLFFGHFRSTSPEDTPFYLLEKRSEAVQRPLTEDEKLLMLREEKEGFL